MTNNLPDERLIYLTLKNTFSGADALIRKAKKVRELIQKQQDSADVNALIQEHNLDSVCNVVKTLLEQEVFESTLKAKIRFPEVFETSPTQGVDYALSGAQVARSVADPTESAIVGHHGCRPRGESQSSHLANQVTLDEVSPKCNLKSTLQPPKRSWSDSTARVPSLHPVYLPYRTQHHLLGTVQAILEIACFEFACRKMKETVDREGWDCPECLELNAWARTLVSHQHLFRKEDLGQLGKSFDQLADSVSHLRHTAVHRLRVSAKALETFLVDAESLARVLDDDDRAKQLMQLRRETQSTLTELECNKDLLESKLRRTLQQISAQKTLLDQLDISAVEEMLRENKKYESLAGASLSRVLQSVATTRFTATLTTVPLRVDIESEASVVSDRSGDHESEPKAEVTFVEG